MSNEKTHEPELIRGVGTLGATTLNMIGGFVEPSGGVVPQATAPARPAPSDVTRAFDVREQGPLG